MWSFGDATAMSFNGPLRLAGSMTLSMALSMTLSMTLSLGLAMATASCGGRVARTVPETTSFDDLLTCTHIVAQIETADARIADLTQEARDQSEQNVGKFLFMGAIWMNLNDSEKKEITALQKRRAELERLKAEKGCP